MEKQLAEQLVRKLHALDGSMGDVMELIEQISDEDEKGPFRVGLGGVMRGVYADLMRPILRQYPELAPSKDYPFKFGGKDAS